MERHKIQQFDKLIPDVLQEAGNDSTIPASTSVSCCGQGKQHSGVLWLLLVRSAHTSSGIANVECPGEVPYAFIAACAIFSTSRLQELMFLMNIRVIMRCLQFSAAAGTC